MGVKTTGLDIDFGDIIELAKEAQRYQTAVEEIKSLIDKEYERHEKYYGDNPVKDEMPVYTDVKNLEAILKYV